MPSGTVAPGVHSLGRVYHTWLISFVQEQNMENRRRLSQARGGCSQGALGAFRCSPWGHEGSDTTKRLHFHFSLSYIGEGNGNPLQYSCLENPRDRRAWWAAVYGLAQSRTRLK